MKLVSWNVNGLAACKRKGFLKSIARLRADIVCCQEVRTNCPLNTPAVSYTHLDVYKRQGNT